MNVREYFLSLKSVVPLTPMACQRSHSFCHLGRRTDSAVRFEDTLSLETLTAIAQLAAKRLTYSQYVSFAGKPLLTSPLQQPCHSQPHILVFSAWDGGAVPEHPAAELRAKF